MYLVKPYAFNDILFTYRKKKKKLLLIKIFIVYIILMVFSISEIGHLTIPLIHAHMHIMKRCDLFLKKWCSMDFFLYGVICPVQVCY